jgi:FUS-interacting serine-arginine-rich protein 1
VWVCRLPRGFGFVQFLEPREAAEAQYCLDHQIIAGREITVVFAEENRKKPQEMRSKERIRYLILMSDSVGLME